MQSQKKITETYDKVAAKYAAKFIDELDHKPLDRLLLEAFCKENQHKGKMLDLGCGPGQTTRFLANCGCADITGTDISPSMIEMAKSFNPELNFEVADMTELKYSDGEFAAAVAFYAIVNFDYPAIENIFKEVGRVLKSNGQFLFSFHTGDEVVHLDELLEEKTDIDFYFLNTDKIIRLLKETGFEIIDAVIRYPYAGEFQSKRAYIRAARVA